MTCNLLDVNVLIALMDRWHTHHETAHRWFAEEGSHSWATCPLTQNAALRILGSPDYPNSPGSLLVVADTLGRMLGLAGHVFWADDISLLDSPLIRRDRMLSSRQITDTYLLALAAAHGGRLATFDRRLVADAVRDGSSALQLIS